jgi:hypothetical protein
MGGTGAAVGAWADPVDRVSKRMLTRRIERRAFMKVPKMCVRIS